MANITQTDKQLLELVLNKLESQEVFDYMDENNLLEPDQLYFVINNDERAIAEYDKDNNGIVDDSERLGGELPEFYASQEDLVELKEDVLKSGTINVHSGDVMVLDDAADNKPLYGLKLYGKTTQDGTPSPANPIPLMSAGDDGDIEISILDNANESTQTLTVSTPNGLPGIPVTSGGNYTDRKGQQWACDEIDFERGVYVLRCEKIESYNGETISTPYISTTGELTIGAEVIYALATPIETPLSAEEIAAYKALYTSKPVTTIFNDSGAGIAVAYAPDNESAKALIDYIPRKTSELTNDSGFITINDVPSRAEVASDAEKLGGNLPSYYASTASIPTNTSQLTNDSGYITSSSLPTKNSELENDSDFATNAEVESKVASLVDSAPTTLNTLNELAAALGDDPNFATTVATQIGEKVPQTRTINGKALDSDISLSAEDVGAEQVGAIGSYMVIHDNDPTAHQVLFDSKVPVTRKINNIPLSSDITLSASDVGADASGTASSTVSTHNSSTSAHSELFNKKQNVPASATALPTSGTALTNNKVYAVSAAVGTYQFVAPTTGWAHGTFTTGSSVAITFKSGAKFIGEVPEFTTSTTYEFDVLNNVWIFAEVVTG